MRTSGALLSLAATGALLLAAGCTTTWRHTFEVDARGIAQAAPPKDVGEVRNRVVELVRKFANERGFSESPAWADSLPEHGSCEREHNGQSMQIRWLTDERWDGYHGENAEDRSLTEQMEFRSEIHTVRVQVNGSGDEGLREDVRRIAEELEQALIAEFGDDAVSLWKRDPSE